MGLDVRMHSFVFYDSLLALSFFVIITYFSVLSLLGAPCMLQLLINKENVFFKWKHVAGETRGAIC